VILHWVSGVMAACLMTAAPAADNWDLVRDDASRKIKVYTRPQAVDNGYDEFRAEMQVPQPLETVVAVLRDVPAWPEWIARIRKVKRLRHDGDSLWVYVIYKLPYPFKERDTVLQSVLRREASGAVVIRSVAVRNPPLPEQDSRRVHLYDLESTWRLTPLPGGGTRIELSGRGEPGGYMPSLIFNYNLPDEPQQTLRLLRVMAEREKYAVKTGGAK
jgi:hypothetical protein